MIEHEGRIFENIFYFLFDKIKAKQLTLKSELVMILEDYLEGKGKSVDHDVHIKSIIEKDLDDVKLEELVESLKMIGEDLRIMVESSYLF